MRRRLKHRIGAATWGNPLGMARETIAQGGPWPAGRPRRLSGLHAPRRSGGRGRHRLRCRHWRVRPGGPGGRRGCYWPAEWVGLTVRLWRRLSYEPGARDAPRLGCVGAAPRRGGQATWTGGCAKRFGRQMVVGTRPDLGAMRSIAPTNQAVVGRLAFKGLPRLLKGLGSMWARGRRTRWRARVSADVRVLLYRHGDEVTAMVEHRDRPELGKGARVLLRRARGPEALAGSPMESWCGVRRPGISPRCVSGSATVC